MRKTSLLPEEKIFKKIIIVRDQKILLDSDLAELYGVSTKVLKQAVRRNIDRFPEDFLFELTSKEWKNLRSQFVTSSLAGQKSWGGQRHTPFAFTEQGVAMLSSVLNSSQAVAVNIQIMRVFVKMRHLITSYRVCSKRLRNWKHRTVRKTNTSKISIGHL